jgi:hypothetical protein
MTGLRSKFLFILLAVALPAFSQRSKPKNLILFDYQPFHFGYSVGLNWMDFTLIPTDPVHYLLNVRQNPGININLITNLRINKWLDLRALPGIQFGQRDLTIKDKINNVERSWKVESVYIDLPIHLKYRSERLNNYAAYLIVGVNPRLDLTGGEIQNWRPVQRLVKAFDIYPELGVGTDFYAVKVKVALELKFGVGMLNIFNPPPGDAPEYGLYANGVKRILSQMMVLAVHVE